MTAALPLTTILAADYFVVFGMEPKFAVDLRALDEAYRELQMQIHPDRFAAGTDAQKRLAVQWATHANEAYKTLKSPVARARYLLRLRGVDTREETHTAMPVDFLMQQMQWREALADAKNDSHVLNGLLAEAREERKALIGTLEQQLQSEENEAAATTVRKLRFVEKFEQELEDGLYG